MRSHQADNQHSSQITTGYKGFSGYTLGQSPHLTLSSLERFSEAVNTLSKCFNNDPVLTFILNNRTREQRLNYLPKLFHVLIKAAVLNDAVVTEIDNWQACAVWMPPGKKVDNWATNIQAGFFTVLWDLGIYGVRQMLLEFSSAVDAVKKVEIAKYGACYYLYFVGTLPEAQGQGRGSRLVEHWQRKAAAEGAAIWLEATTLNSHRLYQRLGFHDVRQLTLGEGKAASDGTYEVGGPGVTLWLMIWLPDGRQVQEKSG